jgi:hypothetical protein
MFRRLMDGREALSQTEWTLVQAFAADPPLVLALCGLRGASSQRYNANA